MLAGWNSKELLILVKTYPVPSKGNRETTCVAAIDRDGVLHRLYPIPFRLMNGTAQFKKWQWIRANIIKANNDHRPESYKVDAESIERLEWMEVGKKGWIARIELIRPHIMSDHAELITGQEETGKSLGIVRPDEILGLDITEDKQPDWSDEERARLQRDCLFDSEEIKNRLPLRKVPYTFHYRYRCGKTEYRHLITDWEIGMLYWNCCRDYGPAGWERKFREKLEDVLPAKDLMFVMGTIHRFPNQWLIVGLIYPPRQAPVEQMAMNFS